MSNSTYCDDHYEQPWWSKELEEQREQIRQLKKERDNAYNEGYQAAKKKIDDEVQRAFLEDYTDASEEYMEAAQGSLARLHMWIEHLMDKEGEK